MIRSTYRLPSLALGLLAAVQALPAAADPPTDGVTRLVAPVEIGPPHEAPGFDGMEAAAAAAAIWEAPQPDRPDRGREKPFLPQLASPAISAAAAGRDPSLPPPLPEPNPTAVRSGSLAPQALRFEITSHETLDDLDDRVDLITEPTAAGGSRLLLTGNHFAAVSHDGGASLEIMDPDTFLTPTREAYCCDQVSAYDPARDLLIWLVQYEQTRAGNFLRLAVSQGEDIGHGRWWEYDLDPGQFGEPEGRWFDFSDLVVGRDHLYLTTFVNDCDCEGRFVRSLAVRIPLDALARYDRFTAQGFTAEDSALRATRGAALAEDEPMAFAHHANTENLRVWLWYPDAPAPEPSLTVPVEPWVEVPPEAPVRQRWLARIDTSIVAAWADGRHAGFAWSAGPQEAPVEFPRPHLRVALFDLEELREAVRFGRPLTPLAEPHLWSGEVDYAYPSLSRDSAGYVGVVVHFAGDDGKPGLAVGLLIEPARVGDPWTWELAATATSTHPPEEGNWGDYLSMRPSADRPGWVTAGSSLEGSAGADGVRVHLVKFARRATSSRYTGRAEPGSSLSVRDR